MEVMNEAPMPEEQPAASPGAIAATPEQQDTLDRITYNAMEFISKQSTAVSGFLNSGESAGDGLSKAITFVMQAVIGGLQKKGIEIPVELVISENGAASQITQLLVSLIGESGGDITSNEIQQAMSVGLQNFATKQRKDGMKGQEAPQEQPTQELPQEAPPQQGLLERTV